MLKFTTKLPQGGQLIGLGFEEGNLVKLKDGMPIRILYSDLKLPWPGGMLVVYPTPEAEVLLSRLVDELSIIKLNDDALRLLREGKVLPFNFDASQVDGSEGGSVMMFWGNDNDALKSRMAGGIGPDTEDASPEVDDGQHRHKSHP